MSPMILQREASPFPQSSTPTPSPNSAVLKELRRLILLSLGAFLLMALLSYSPEDPSLSTWSTREEIRNWMGRTGSVVADSFFQLLGLAALVLPGIPLFLAFRKLVTTKKDWPGVAFLCFTLAVFFEAFFPSHLIPWGLRNAGGVCGRFGNEILVYLVGRIGTGFLSVVLVAVAVIIVFQIELFKKTTDLFQNSAEKTRSLPEKWMAWFKGLKIFKRVPKVESGEVKVATISAKNPEAKKESFQVVTAALSAMENIPGRLEKMAESAIKAVTGDPVIAERVQPVVVNKVPKRLQSHKNKNYQLPDLAMLSGKAESKVKTVEKSWYLEKANILVQKLKDFGVEGEVVHISPGPVITVYEFKPASGVKIKEIANLSDDLTLALSALSVRIVAPIPGKPVVGIEIPSPHREMVYFKDLIQETPFFSQDLKIPIALGRLASGEPVAADLATMPHLLIAGSTGTGKSVFINTLISSLLFRFSPDQLKLILVDPKMVELSTYEAIPHLLLPVVVDSKKAVMALRWAVDEMERRYTLMHQAGVRHIDIYNDKLTDAQKKGDDPVHQFLPYIVVVIDEYADLMAVVPKEVELSIARLAQKARASGIHLVLATQRPSTDVVTGTIKANFPSRISFRVASSIDSKTILDRTGSERLLGYGDLLFHSPGFTTLKRMQGPYLSDDDISRIVEHLKSQGEPVYDERILQEPEGGFELGTGDADNEENKLYDMAVRIVSEKGEASISLIQRHLKIGYNRAASIMERMEKEGVVGGSTGPAKRRSVLVGGI